MEWHRGRERQSIDPKASMELAQNYTLIVIGSRASDKVFERITQHLTTGARRKFRFYSRSYFDGYLDGGEVTDTAMNKAWMEILKMNHIVFDLQAKIIGDDYSITYEDFNWKKLKAFISDKRSTFIETRDDIFGAGL